jgi:hypothetical protein
LSIAASDVVAKQQQLQQMQQVQQVPGQPQGQPTLQANGKYEYKPRKLPVGLPGEGAKHVSTMITEDTRRRVKDITPELLREYFHMPISQAAKCLGLCATLLKTICRKKNIYRWPYRQVSCS